MDERHEKEGRRDRGSRTFSLGFVDVVGSVFYV